MKKLVRYCYFFLQNQELTSVAIQTFILTIGFIYFLIQLDFIFDFDQKRAVKTYDLSRILIEGYYNQQNKSKMIHFLNHYKGIFSDNQTIFTLANHKTSLKKFDTMWFFNDKKSKYKIINSNKMPIIQLSYDKLFHAATFTKNRNKK